MPQVSKAFLRITAIEPQKKRSGRFNIYLDNRFGFAIDENNLVESHLRVGQILTNLQIEKFTGKNQLGKLLDSSLRFLSYRPRSEKEVIDYLTKKIAASENIKFHQAKENPLIKKIIAKLKKYNYLNDREFANWLISSRIRSGARGVIYLKLELKTKGVDPDIVESILLDRSVDELKLAKSALAKKAKRWRGLSGIDLKKKGYQYLASRGFSYETIKEAFANLAKKD